MNAGEELNSTHSDSLRDANLSEHSSCTSSLAGVLVPGTLPFPGLGHSAKGLARGSRYLSPAFSHITVGTLCLWSTVVWWSAWDLDHPSPNLNDSKGLPFG